MSIELGCTHSNGKDVLANPRGIQIIIHGPRRSGKTTVADKLAKFLKKEGYTTKQVDTRGYANALKSKVDYDVLIVDETEKVCKLCVHNMSNIEF